MLKEFIYFRKKMYLIGYDFAWGFVAIPLLYFILKYIYKATYTYISYIYIYILCINECSILNFDFVIYLKYASFYKYYNIHSNYKYV